MKKRDFATVQMIELGSGVIVINNLQKYYSFCVTIYPMTAALPSHFPFCPEPRAETHCTTTCPFGS